MAYKFGVLATATWLAANAVRIDDDTDEVRVTEAAHIDEHVILLKSERDGVNPVDMAGLKESTDEEMANGSNMSTEPYLVPSEGSGGKIIRNVGCSKDLRRTVATVRMSVVNTTIDVLNCKALAMADIDCGKEVYTDGRHCVCVARGKQCDVITMPGNTMFIPTTTLPPNPLHPPTPCPPIPAHCNLGEWISPSSGDIPGPPYALGHTGDLEMCKVKCCEDKLCEAIKFSPEAPNGTFEPGRDDCALYLDMRKFDRQAEKDRNFDVHIYAREPSENATEANGGIDWGAKHKFDTVKAFEARMKADTTFDSVNKTMEKWQVLEKTAKDLEAARAESGKKYNASLKNASL